MAERARRGPGMASDFLGTDRFEASAPVRVYSRDFLDSFWGRRPGHELPLLDVSEDEARYIVTAELPGVERSDVTVELHDGALAIRGEKRSDREPKSVRRHSVERAFGAFSRSVALPHDADPERTHAVLADGVLTVTVAKRGERKPRAVEIQGSREGGGNPP